MCVTTLSICCHRRHQWRDVFLPQEGGGSSTLIAKGRVSNGAQSVIDLTKVHSNQFLSVVQFFLTESGAWRFSLFLLSISLPSLSPKSHHMWQRQARSILQVKYLFPPFSFFDPLSAITTTRTTTIITRRFLHGHIKAEAVDFSISLSEAEQCFREWHNAHWLAPTSSIMEAHSVSACWLPFWVFDATVVRARTRAKA